MAWRKSKSDRSTTLLASSTLLYLVLFLFGITHDAQLYSSLLCISRSLDWPSTYIGPLCVCRILSYLHDYRIIPRRSAKSGPPYNTSEAPLRQRYKRRFLLTQLQYRTLDKITQLGSLTVRRLLACRVRLDKPADVWLCVMATVYNRRTQETWDKYRTQGVPYALLGYYGTEHGHLTRVVSLPYY